ncbi:PREDICTED: uncharacterized protein LOC18614044 [Theobroma cacao]|uniref:Uncharacterized protein LOC18614044 n=1 Tax=Theobroma cacao TaxID=3641 RepID=A0AB32VSI8_THECC|nr:PREDICTED: uncharacterized protein LOC18614044 [Theobroma cacao]
MENNYVLEITLISAQGLKEPSGKLRRMQTYALAWIDSSVKLRTCVDRVGGENPTWNDKFLFKVSSEFLSSETSGISVEIFAVGVLRDSLVGTVRFLVSNFLPSGSAFNAAKTHSFNAVQIRRPSGRFQGVLNIGATVLDGAYVPSWTGVSAMGFRDLIGHRSLKKSKSALPISRENLFPDSDDQSDGCDSTTSSSSSASASTALKEWNAMVRELNGTNHVRSSSEDGRVLCGLMTSSPRKAAYLCPFMFSQSFNEGKLTNERSRFA